MNFCPNCDAELEFAQCDWRTCKECGWEGGWHHTKMFSRRQLFLDNRTEAAIKLLEEHDFQCGLVSTPQPNRNCAPYCIEIK